MQWKFWNWRKASAASVPNGNGAAREQSAAQVWLPLAGSQKELVALQRTIGNQAVLRLLIPETQPEEKVTPAWWRMRPRRTLGRD
jgi:hypothetical protein